MRWLLSKQVAVGPDREPSHGQEHGATTNVQPSIFHPNNETISRDLYRKLRSCKHTTEQCQAQKDQASDMDWSSWENVLEANPVGLLQCLRLTSLSSMKEWRAHPWHSPWSARAKRHRTASLSGSRRARWMRRGQPTRALRGTEPPVSRQVNPCGAGISQHAVTTEEIDQSGYGHGQGRF